MKFRKESYIDMDIIEKQKYIKLIKDKFERKLAKEFKKHHLYIVGGFVRDYVLGNTTNDVDICTDATPKDIKDIFENITLRHL